MDEKERDSMLREEETASYNGLIMEAEWVFKHPILREWVKVAPSVNSIDKWISNQFNDFEYKLDLIKIMRKAVKVWQKTGGQDKKNLLETPKGWRLADIFMFNPGKSNFHAVKNTESNLTFADSIRFLVDPAKAISCKHWPLFLSEFGYEIGPDRVLKTSVDSLPIDANQFWAIKEMKERFWEDRTAEAFDGNPSDLIDSTYEIKFKRKTFEGGKKIVWTDILLEKFGITTQIVQVEPQIGEIYPRFYKTVVFRDKHYGSPKHSIKILWPIDCFHSRQKGWVGFSKSIKVGHQMEVALNLNYKFDGDFKLVVSPEHVSYDPHSHIQIQISNVQQSLLFQENCPVPEKSTIMEAVEILFENFVEAWEFSIEDPNISLHSILGEDIIRNPPNSLLQIFTNPLVE